MMMMSLFENFLGGKTSRIKKNFAKNQLDPSGGRTAQGYHHSPTARPFDFTSPEGDFILKSKG